ncbi:MAG: acyl carrier protein [Bacteroidales bacterium]|jgi:acyl carrier protein|nr:acyl carrier protein [Bacteroidales bacterium]
MDQTTILNQLQEIFVDVFDDDDITISRNTNSKDIKDWDSITQVMLISTIEKKFDIHFTGNEIVQLQCVGDLIDAIERKQ